MDPDEAFRLEAGVLAARLVERQSWVILAERLADFHAAEAWKLLSYERFADWLGNPEVGLSRRSAYRLVQAWKWAGKYEVPASELARVDLTKLGVIIPPVEAGLVSALEAVEDAAMLSRSDLVEKYGGSRGARAESATAVEHWQHVDYICPACGHESQVEVPVAQAAG